MLAGKKTYMPHRRDYPLSGLVLYAPLWHPGLSGSPTIISKDLNAHTCTVTGATWGKYGRTFDGDNDYINCGVSSAFEFTAFTLEGWIKRGEVDAIHAILAKSGASGNRSWAFRVVDTNKLNFWISPDGTNVSQSEVPTDIDTNWHHVAAIWDGTNGTPYLDTVAGDTFVQGTLHAEPTIGVFAGVRDSVNLDQDFKGIIGELRIYNRALSAGEIMQNYQKTKWRYI